LEDNPRKKINTPEEWNSTGLELYLEESYKEAIECFDAALALQSDYFRAWKNKGMVLEGQGMYKDAVGCYDKALSFLSNYSMYYDLLCDLKKNALELLQEEEDEGRESEKESFERNSSIAQQFLREREMKIEEEGKSDFEL